MTEMLKERFKLPQTSSLFALPSGRVAKWVVLALWLVVVGVVAPFGGKLTGALKNDAAAWLPTNSESTRALDLQKQFPGSNVYPAVVVYQREGGITAADRWKAEHDQQTLASRPYMSSSEAPTSAVVPSQDGKALLVVLPITGHLQGPEYVDVIKNVRDSVGRGGDGLDVKVTGPSASLADLINAFAGLDIKILLLTVSVVAVLLLLIYRSPILWLVPLLAAGLTSQVATGSVYGLIKATGLTVNFGAYSILTVLVFGAGTDYALLLIARYREELRRHRDKHQAMATALRGAGPAILASGATVSIGLLCLLASDLPTNRGLGPVGAIAIVAALLAMLTLLPAVLVIAGRWIFWPFIPSFGSHSHEATGLWSRVGHVIERAPRLIWMGSAVVLAVLALGLTHLNTNLSPEHAFLRQTDSAAGQLLLAASFPSGSGQPAVIIARAELTQPVLEAARTTPGVSQAQVVNQAQGRVEIQATLDAAPNSAQEGQIIQRLRDRLHPVTGADAVVGGNGAVMFDVNQALSRDQNLIIPLVLLVILAILVVLLRSLVAPLLLVATVGLSFAASLGAGVWAFDHIFHFQALDPSVPLTAFIYLVALGVDYNIFLMHRARQESARVGTRRGTLHALAVTGGVITSAGLVMAATFSVLDVIPTVAEVETGVLIAFGVLLDTLIVRSVLVPALTLDLGRVMWWPSRLWRSPVDAVNSLAA
jgi:RND superfamily putative drug exporter